MTRSYVPSLALALLILSGLLVASCTDPSSGSVGDDAPPASSADSRSALPSTAPGPYPDRIVLNWAGDPSSTLSATWRTDTTVADAKAQIAPARAEPSFYEKARTVEAETQALPSGKVSGESVSAAYHTVTFENLDADELYAYRVGDGEHWSEWIHARTASAEPEPFSFLYVGDAQNNVRSHWSRLIRQAYADAPDADFLLHAGDLVDHAHENVEWGHWNAAGGFIQSMVPNLAVPGNHEYAGYRTWRERDTFQVEVKADEQEMTGTILEPDGNPEPLEATSNNAAPSKDAYPAGDWDYDVDNGEYVGTLEIEGGSSGYSATLVSENGDEYPLHNVSVDGNTLTGHFLMEVEKESTEKLSVHWQPQFALPENGPEGLEETVYFLDHQGTRIIGLNSEPATVDEQVLEKQTEWLASTLRDAQEDPEIRWTIATFHHPLFSSGEGRSNEALRRRGDQSSTSTTWTSSCRATTTRTPAA
ncbi:MAG: fibronectin type III domain-containing protein, partial [Salinibacter sp.]